MTSSVYAPYRVKSVKELLGENFESILEGAIKRKLVSGIGIGIFRDKEFFLATSGNGVAENSIYEMGSITKSFTCELLHKMVERSQLRWEDRLERFLPNRTPTSTTSKSRSPITLGDLVLHRAGLSLPENYKTADRENPNGSFSQSDLLDYLQQLDLTKSDSEPFGYSNIGYAALGFALEQASGRSYEELIQEEILTPLKLNNTSLALYGRTGPSVIQGHTQGGRAVPPWRQQAFAPAGALCSTVPDMLRWCEFTIENMKAKMLETKVESYDARSAMGWEKSTVHDWYIRDGETGGFSTFLGVDVLSNTAVVLMANRNSSKLLRALADNATRVISGDRLIALSGNYGKHRAFMMDLPRRNKLSGYIVTMLKESRGGALAMASLRRFLKGS